MTPDLYRAIQNRDGEMLARMAGDSYEGRKVVNADAEKLVDMFLKTSCRYFRHPLRRTSVLAMIFALQSSNGSPPSQSQASHPVNNFQPVCKKPAPASLRSGRRQVSLFRGAVRGMEH